jgi:hypothetical protein
LVSVVDVISDGCATALTARTIALLIGRPLVSRTMPAARPACANVDPGAARLNVTNAAKAR